MAQANITFFGNAVIVACDGNCAKAWGVSQRPEIKLSDDDDDVVHLADGELGIAPVDPGTYEGGEGKPSGAAEFPNKWCVRECERCAMVDKNKPITLPDWSVRRFNLPWRIANGIL